MSAESTFKDDSSGRTKERCAVQRQEEISPITQSGQDTADMYSVQMKDIQLGQEEVDTAKQREPDKPSDLLKHLAPCSQRKDQDQDQNLPPAVTPNAYVGKRNFIHQLMDVALMMANVSQLKALLVSENNRYYYLLLTFICLSICLQLVFTIFMLIIWSLEKTIEEQSKPETLPKEHYSKIERKKWLATWLDRTGSVLVLFIIVSNVFIAGFGFETHKENNS